MDAQTTRVRRGERSRGGAILEAARELFFKNGYRGTTVQQIASQAGYSKRTVYLDYLSKDELFMTICVEGGELLLKNLSEIPLHEFSAEAGLERIMQAYVAFSREQSEYFRMIFSDATPAIIARLPQVWTLFQTRWLMPRTPEVGSPGNRKTRPLIALTINAIPMATSSQ